MILSSPEVQKRVEDLFPWSTYNDLKVYKGLFNEKDIGDAARVDYLEICEKLIEFNLRPFFLMNSSKSTASKEAPIENPKQP